MFQHHHQEHQARISRATKTAVIFLIIGFVLLIPGPYFLVKSTAKYNPYTGDSYLNEMYRHTGIACVVMSTLIILFGFGICFWICKHSGKAASRQRQQQHVALSEGSGTNEPLVTTDAVMMRGYSQVPHGPCLVTGPHQPGYRAGISPGFPDEPYPSPGTTYVPQQLVYPSSPRQAPPKCSLAAPPPSYSEVTGKGFPLNCVISKQ